MTTIDAGLRWDISSLSRGEHTGFLGNLTNPATGTPGANQFAGNQGSGAASATAPLLSRPTGRTEDPRVRRPPSLHDDKTVFLRRYRRASFSERVSVGERGKARAMLAG